jgi:outer membrane protein OmpA-like peptidoglycan-associated protein
MLRLTVSARLLPPALPAALTGLLMAACATHPEPQGAVVLLPNPAGRETAVTVTQGPKQLVLDQSYAAARLTSEGPQPYAAGAQEVQARFGEALAARPAAPTQFTLYFVEGSDEFTPESKKAIDEVFGEIARRPVPDVLVVGHTDKVGSDAFNDPLSRQRAETVRAALLGRGLPPDKVVAIGRGKREPAVPTADGVAEPRNRRVEIQVR